ncbi:hypothetical protein FACS1894176_11560 [Bacteroidia bacterium]|nr:hypothetical protein FACS1894176_11560 [Bacteroidia bacterium]
MKTQVSLWSPAPTLKTGLNRGKILVVMLLLLFAGEASGVTYPHKVTDRKAVVYADTTANAKKLGKLKEDRKISTFGFEGNWAKIRYKKKWAYVKAADLAFYPFFTTWEVASKTANVYGDANGKKRIGTLARGKFLDAPFASMDSTGQFVEFHYSSKQNGFIHIADIQPLPAYYEVIATSHLYKQANVNAELKKRDKLVNGEWVKVDFNFDSGDTVSVTKFINEKWGEYGGNYIQRNNLKALPDSICADLQEISQDKWEREYNSAVFGRMIDDLRNGIEDYAYWIVLILTFLPFLIIGLSTHNRNSEKWVDKHYAAITLIPLYALALLIVLCELHKPHSFGDPFTKMFLSGAFFKEIGKMLLAAGVLILNLSVLAEAFHKIRYSRYGNFFIALLAVAFPAAVLAITLINI